MDPTADMAQSLAHNWWVFALRGVLAIIFGVLAFVWPAMTLTVLVLLFGAYVLVDGVFALITAFRARGHVQHLWTLIVEGVVCVGAGILTFIYPGVTTLVLLYIIAFWAILTGLFEMIAAVRLRREIEHEWLLILAGMLSLLFGVLLAINPAAGALAVVFIIGAYAIVFGMTLVVLALRLRRWSHRAGSPTLRPAPA
jgi:uncharacterized membrane protein HdeD (DUF308 family)